MFFEEQFQKTNQEELRVKKIFKRKGDKFYVKWKVFDNLFNIWINKKDIDEYFPKPKPLKGNVKV